MSSRSAGCQLCGRNPASRCAAHFVWRHRRRMGKGSGQDEDFTLRASIRQIVHRRQPQTFCRPIDDLLTNDNSQSGQMAYQAVAQVCLSCHRLVFTQTRLTTGQLLKHTEPQREMLSFVPLAVPPRSAVYSGHSRSEPVHTRTLPRAHMTCTRVQWCIIDSLLNWERADFII